MVRLACQVYLLTSGPAVLLSEAAELAAERTAHGSYLEESVAPSGSLKPSHLRSFTLWHCQLASVWLQ
jgi:hypothetical protein